MFPIDTILSENDFKKMDVVVCGHSLGGAIASIVAVNLLIRLKQLSQKRFVKCITFGAPLFGDRVLKNYVPKEISNSIHHFVNINDPVPNLLRYTQTIKPWLQDINNHLSVIPSNVQGPEVLSSEESTRNKLKEIKNSYGNVIETINQVMCIAETAVNVAALLYPGLSAVKEFQKVFSLIGDVTTALTDNRNVYVPIGNFHFLPEDGNDEVFFSCEGHKELEQYMQVKYQQKAKEITPNPHALSHYTKWFQENEKFPFGGYPMYFEEPILGTCENTFVDRDIQRKDPFRPKIYSVELTKSRGDKIFLKLSFTGKYIHNVVLDLCQFNFGFPFGKNKEKVKTIKSFTAERIQRLVIEEEIEDDNIALADQGTVLLLVTQFGECEEMLRPGNVRDIAVQSVRQIAESDSVSLVVRRAIQRGMALKKIKKKYHCISSEQIIDEITQLGAIAIGEELMKTKETEIFTEYVEKIDYVFSNEQSFRNVKDFCDEIEAYIRSPLYIEAERTVIQKIGVVFTAIAGAAIFGFIAGPGLVLIGVPEATSAGLVCLGGTAGIFTGGATATFLMNDQLTDCNYKNALNFIVQELNQAQQESLGAIARAEITDLLDEDNFFSIEKAVTRLAPQEMLETEIFENSILSNATDKSKKEVIKRIKAIQSIHRIREIFSQQCFIGVVGLQDAGKTTLIKKIWNVGDKSGYFAHTKRQELYQITQKLLVVDFPGSNSLHYYSKTFSICGAMNNMIIAVIPFSGDVSEIHSQEIARVYGVMKGSKNTKIVLCINKCGLYLNKLRGDLVSQEKPEGYLKQVFIKELNNHFERNEESVRLDSTDIFFTDWELEGNQESVDFGIIGVEEIKDIIKVYLVDNGIYKSSETDELQKCVSFVSN